MVTKGRRTDGLVSHSKKSIHILLFHFGPQGEKQQINFVEIKKRAFSNLWVHLMSDILWHLSVRPNTCEFLNIFYAGIAAKHVRFLSVTLTE